MWTSLCIISRQTMLLPMQINYHNEADCSFWILSDKPERDAIGSHAESRISQGRQFPANAQCGLWLA